MLHAVLFDLDDTLLDGRGSFEHFIRDQWKRFGPAVQVIRSGTFRC
jgi:FMN phosphatase YigB (HAD superfamily)